MVGPRDLRANLAANVRRLREKQGWTQERAAEACELDLRTIQRIEGGELDTSLSVLEKLAEGFNTAPTEILTPSEPAPKRRRGRPRRPVRVEPTKTSTKK